MARSDGSPVEVAEPTLVEVAEPLGEALETIRTETPVVTTAIARPWFRGRGVHPEEPRDEASRRARTSTNALAVTTATARPWFRGSLRSHLNQRHGEHCVRLTLVSRLAEFILRSRGTRRLEGLAPQPTSLTGQSDGYSPATSS